MSWSCASLKIKEKKCEIWETKRWRLMHNRGRTNKLL